MSKVKQRKTTQEKINAALYKFEKEILKILKQGGGELEKGNVKIFWRQVIK